MTEVATAYQFPMPTPRPYQVESVEAFFRDGGDGVIQIFTGGGKTITAGLIVSRMPGREGQPGRTLFLAHTDELVRQTCRTMLRVGLWPAVEKADEYQGDEYIPDPRERKKLFAPRKFPPTEAFQFNRILVSSMQSFVGRVDKYREGGFDLLIIDEGHRSNCATYRQIFEKLRQYNPEMRLLLLSATPYRFDGKRLLATKYFHRMRILDGIEEGYLVPVRCEKGVAEGIDESVWKVGATKHGRDITDKSLSKSMDNQKCIESIAHEIIDKGEGRKGIVFLPGIKVAESVTAALNAIKPGVATFVHGKVPKDERKKRVRMHEDGDVKLMVGVMAMCLDDQTEVLTAEGWRGIDTLREDDRVANWHGDTGAVTFEFPSRVVRRERAAGEEMVSLQTRRMSIRVTGDHRVVWYDHKMQTRVDLAHDLIGKTMKIPVTGVAAPLPLTPTQEEKGGTAGARIRANSYSLRKKGLSPEEAKAEAVRRAAHRDALRYKNPDELTPEECEFIGFWLADGAKYAASKGGSVFQVMEGESLPAVCARIEHLIASMGVAACRRTVYSKPNNVPVSVWNLPRGTGFGDQQRNGIYPIEPYLDKGENRLLWAFTREQFVALLYGLWMGNGTNHKDQTRPKSSGFSFVMRHKGLIDTIQAVAVCRGIHCGVRPVKKDEDHHSQQYIVSVNLDRTYHSTHIEGRLAAEIGWKAERVWCVSVPSTFIITRRDGKVSVTGNCEGYDVPDVSLVVLARMTQSKGLVEQKIGRGLRVLAHAIEGKHTAAERRAAIAASAKKDLLVLDFANSSRHRFASADDVLLTSDDPKLSEFVKKHKDVKDKRQVREQLEELEALYDLEEALRAPGTLPPKVAYTYEQVNLFGSGGYQKTESHKADDAKRPTTQLVADAHDVMIPQRLAEGMTHNQLWAEVQRRRETRVGRKGFGFLRGACKLSAAEIDSHKLNWHDAQYLRKLVNARPGRDLPANWVDLVTDQRKKRARGGN